MYKHIACLLIALSVAISFAYAQEERLTITTYYPSPAGSYNQLGTNKLAVDIAGVAVSSEYTAMRNGDAHIGRSLIVGAGGGSGFAFDELAPADTQDGDLIIKHSVRVATTAALPTPTTALLVQGDVAVQGRIDISSAGPSGKVVCWRADRTLGFCQDAPSPTGNCTCN